MPVLSCLLRIMLVKSQRHWGTSVEYLVNGEAEKKNTISVEAMQIACLYQQLPTSDKAVVERITKALSV